MVAVHVKEFLDLMSARGYDEGLGKWTEESLESLHHEANVYWTERKMKRELTHPDYASQLKKLQVTMNSTHQGSKD